MKRLLSVLIVLLLAALTAIPAAAEYDEEAPHVLLSDSANEMIYDNEAPPYEGPAELPLLGASGSELPHTLDAADFLSDTENAAYVDTMVWRYLERFPALTDTLASGGSVLFFFEGCSDNTANGRYASDTDYRDGALALVVRYDEESTPYIAAYCQNCSTMPDYPHGYEYDNGHDGYGAATLMDGIYHLWNVNHRGTHAGYFTHVDGQGCAPCVYLRDDGGFSILNGTGIDVHTRLRDSVSGDVTTPTSAGCLTVGDNETLEEYNDILTAFNADRFSLNDTEFVNGAPTFLFNEEDEWKTAGMLVVDRFRAKDRMKLIYGSDAAVEAITAFSADMQADENNILGGCTVYPSNLDLTLPERTAVTALPSATAENTGTVSGTVRATALYENAGGECYYRILTESGAGFVPAVTAESAQTLYDDLGIHNAFSPEEKPYGNACSVSGITESAYNRYVAVTGTVSDEAGTVESECTVTGDFHSYSLDASDGAGDYYESLDYNLAFSGLPVGTHVYRVTGTVKNYYIENGELTFEEKTETLLEKPFTVTPLSVTTGDGAQWTRGEEGSLSFTCNAARSRFTGVGIDGTDLGEGEYTLDETSPVSLTVSDGVLNALTPGAHTLTVHTRYGDATAEFTVICPHTHTEVRGAKDATVKEEGYTGDIWCVDCETLLTKGSKTDKLPPEEPGEEEDDPGKKPEPDPQKEEDKPEPRPSDEINTKNDPSGKNEEKQVDTGDESHLILWLFIACVSGIAAVCAVLARKKQ